MNVRIAGIHHVTAMAGPAQRNLDFYAGLLGLRFVKKTVNFDDPGTYHFYYGDETGRPGTILTFFPWPDALPGHPGAGQATVVAFAIPDAAVDAWAGYLADRAVPFEGPAERGGERVIGLRDPDGIRLELVGVRGDAEAGWSGGPVQEAYAIRSLYSVTLQVPEPDDTAAVLTEVFGYEAAGQVDDRLRFRAGTGPAAVVDIAVDAGARRGTMGTGVIHHVAFRVPDDEAEAAVREALLARGLDVTSVRDRQYFRSIYFREPGGVLFEMATDVPGFLVDEEVDHLGTDLKLPPWLEPRRSRIEQRLPALRTPRYPTSGA